MELGGGAGGGAGAGGGRGSGISWVGDGKGVFGAFIARHRAKRQMRQAVEADLTERGIPVAWISCLGFCECRNSRRACRPQSSLESLRI